MSFRHLFGVSVSRPRFRRLPEWLFTVGVAALAGCSAVEGAGEGAVAIDEDDIGGVVTGASGPEAGVWVIAETNDAPCCRRRAWTCSTPAIFAMA